MRGAGRGGHAGGSTKALQSVHMARDVTIVMHEL
jgi:hypothetical protein